VAIDVVLFDYSGVMTSSFVVPTSDRAFDAEALFTEMVGAMTQETPAHPWHDLERGEISLAAFIEYIEGQVPGAGVAFAVDSPHNVMANLELRPDRVALVRHVASTGRRVGLVTNNVAEWEPLWRAGLPEDLFELIIDSSAVGHRKPEAAIYELAIDHFDVAADRALFVDDFGWNVEGALAAGLSAVLCGADTDLDQVVAAALSGAS